MITYAQNFEDILLWRALKHVDKGFYIDVGANDPQNDSVTRLFYESGWRGINVEPIHQWFAKLNYYRVRDINLNIAAGSERGELVMFEIPDTGLSTSDKDIALRHKIEADLDSTEVVVDVRTLTDICNLYHISPIHFLKIDVEGSEMSVIKGIDLSLIRPWIIVVEATLPNTQIENYEDWEEIFLNHDYEFVYFDGLNRFYVAEEHSDLKQHFKTPINIFDGLLLSGCGSSSFQQQYNVLSNERDKLEKGFLSTKEEKENITSELTSLKAENDVFSKELNTIRTLHLELASELKLQTAEKEELASELKLQTAEKEELASELKLQTAEKEELVSELKLQTAEKEELVSELKLQTAEKEELVSELKLQTAEKEELDSELKLQTAEKEELDSELKLQTAEKEELVSELKLQTAEKEELDSELKLQTAEKEELDSELKLQTAEKEELVSELKLQTAEKEELVSELKLQTAEKEELVSELKLQTAEKEELVSELKLQTANNEVILAEQLTAHNNVIEHINSQVFVQKVEISKIKEQLATEKETSYTLMLEAKTSKDRANAMEKSMSWRLMWPMRLFYTLLLKVVRVILWLPLQIVKAILSIFIPIVLKYEPLAGKLALFLKKWGWLHHHLLNLAEKKQQNLANRNNVKKDIEVISVADVATHMDEVIHAANDHADQKGKEKAALDVDELLFRIRAELSH